jgi:TRAP-type C4-dicarboxylate transport system permease large subunit
MSAASPRQIVAMTIDTSLIEGFMIGLAPGILVGLALALIGARMIYRTGWWAEVEKKRRVK